MWYRLEEKSCLFVNNLQYILIVNTYTVRYTILQFITTVYHIMYFSLKDYIVAIRTVGIGLSALFSPTVRNV